MQIVLKILSPFINNRHSIIRLCLLVIICLNLLISVQAQAQTQTIRVFGPHSAIDPVHKYFIELTKLILSKTDNNHSTKIKLIENMDVTQGRLLRQFELNKADILWTATNIDREKRFLPIRIPLFKGLLGYRVALIRKDELEQFKKIKTPAQLKSLIACQGAHWPDSDILEENGYLVSRVVHYDAMFKMLARKRCDYFPRGIFEAYVEQQSMQKQFPTLVVMDNFILHYKFPIYFFVRHGNEKLAQRLRQGLLMAQQDGSWLRLLKHHRVTKHLFPLSQWKNRHFFELTNNELPKETPVADKALWFNLKTGD